MAEYLSRRTIARDVEQGTKFLGTISRRRAVRSQLARGAGYTQADHDLGWRLLFAVLGYRAQDAGELEPIRSSAADRATAELDAWDGPNFTRARAALQHEYPEQGEYIFSGLRAAQGNAAIGAVRTFLERATTLRDGRDAQRTSTRREDREAVELLAKRCILNADIERHLRELLTVATGQGEPVEQPEVDPDSDDEYQHDAIAFHAWLRDWRAQARAVITKPLYLYLLGLSTPSSSDGEGDEAGDEEIGEVAAVGTA